MTLRGDHIRCYLNRTATVVNQEDKCKVRLMMPEETVREEILGPEKSGLYFQPLETLKMVVLKHRAKYSGARGALL